MFTLLKAESIQSIRQFFSDNGMKSTILRTNLVLANLWLDKLLVKLTDDYDNEPITWIRGMIERSPERRPSSEELAHWTIGTANASRFVVPPVWMRMRCLVRMNQYHNSFDNHRWNLNGPRVSLPLEILQMV